MTVSTLINRMDPVGTGGAGPFAYTFKIFSSSHLYVYVGGVLKTINTHYTVSGVGAPTGGNVTFTAGNEPVNGVAILIVRVVPLTQLSDYVNHAAFDAEVLEMDLDKTIMMAQQFNETLNRIAKVGVTSLLTNVTVQEGAGKFLRWNNAGTAIEAENVVPIGQDLSAYALLAGRAGGQTLIGGSAVADILKLQGTAGNGTLTSPAIQGLVGNAGGTIAFTVLNNGNVGIGTTSPGAQLSVNGLGQSAATFDTAGALGGSLLLSDTGLNINNGGALIFAAAGQAWKFAAIKGLVQDGSNNTQGTIGFFTRKVNTDATLSQVVTIMGSGKVGIGPIATAPLGILCLDGGLHVGGMSDAGDNNLLVDGTGTITGAFGCNGTTPQTAYASGGALNAYSGGGFGLNTAGNMSDLHALVVAMRAALVANGIMS